MKHIEDHGREHPVANDLENKDDSCFLCISSFCFLSARIWSLSPPSVCRRLERLHCVALYNRLGEARVTIAHASSGLCRLSSGMRVLLLSDSCPIRVCICNRARARARPCYGITDTSQTRCQDSRLRCHYQASCTVSNAPG